MRWSWWFPGPYRCPIGWICMRGIRSDYVEEVATRSRPPGSFVYGAIYSEFAVGTKSSCSCCPAPYVIHPSSRSSSTGRRERVPASAGAAKMEIRSVQGTTRSRSLCCFCCQRYMLNYNNSSGSEVPVKFDTQEKNGGGIFPVEYFMCLSRDDIDFGRELFKYKESRIHVFHACILGGGRKESPPGTEVSQGRRCFIIQSRRGTSRLVAH